MNGARLNCLSTMLLVLVQEKTVNLVSLSLAFQGITKPESSYRRIKRFFTEVRLDKVRAARLILSFLPPPPYTVCVDRTNWQFGKLDINILVIAVAYRGVAFPIVWTFLDKQGNSSSEERIDLLQNFFKLVEPQDIAFFLADREFIGVSWFNYLDKRHVPFAIRIRKDSLCDNRCSVYALFAHLPVGELKALHHAYSIYGCTLRVVGMKLSRNDYAIVATNQPPAQAFLAYKRRWEIEMLFAALKKTGFDIESSHLNTRYKLDTLITLLAIAFSWAHRVGEWLHDSNVKPLRRKSHLRKEKSFFRQCALHRGYGLDHLRHLLKNLPRKHHDLLFCIRLLSRTLGVDLICTARPEGTERRAINWYWLSQNSTSILGVCYSQGFFLVALFAPLLAPRDSLFISSRALRQSTSWWTTALGEDIFWQLLQPLGRVLSGQVWLETQDLARLSPDALRRTRWREFSVVFQASMNVLNPVTRMREQIYDPLRAHAQMDKAALARRAEELFALIDIDPNYLDAYPHRLLGGMKQRVVIAIALVLEPDLLIMDEPTTALDVVVQRTPLQESDRVRRTLGISVIFIIHDLAGAHYISDRTAVMYAGRLVKVGPSTALIYSPKHPYPQLLRRAAPKPETGLEPERVHAKGELDVAAPPVSCPFAHEASLA